MAHRNAVHAVRAVDVSVDQRVLDALALVVLERVVEDLTELLVEVFLLYLRLNLLFNQLIQLSLMFV